MAGVSYVLMEDHFLCPICEEVSTDPVTTPCGHDVCKTCLNKHSDDSDGCQCPVCKEVFSTRALLKVSTFVPRMVPSFQKQKEWEKEQVDLERLVQERREKINNIQGAVEFSQKNADREMKKGVRFFSALIRHVQQSLDEFKQSIEEKHKETEEEATVLLEDIEGEISELEQRRAEIKKLSEDHLYFQQTFTSVKPVPRLKDWTDVTVRAPFYPGTFVKAASIFFGNLRKGLPQLCGTFKCNSCKQCENIVETDGIIDVHNNNNYEQKDFIDCNTESVIYRLSCPCPEGFFYIGFTRQSLKRRLSDHKSYIKAQKKPQPEEKTKTAIAKHFRDYHDADESLLRIQGIEHVKPSPEGNTEIILKKREAYWQNELNACKHPGLNSYCDKDLLD